MNLAHHNRGSPEEVGLKPAAYIIKNQYPGESKGEIDGSLGPHISTEELTPQEAGKIWLGGIVNRNRALLGKWLWRYPIEHHSLGCCYLE